MTVALRSPATIGALVSVDNAPVDATLRSDFAKYIQGMKQIEDRQVTKHSEAEDILAQYEKVRNAWSWFFAPLYERRIS